jgi:hypothetical protein
MRSGWSVLFSAVERELAGKNISNPGPNMVMHSKVGPGGKRKFSGPHFELTVELGQVAEGNLLEFDHRREARHRPLHRFNWFL